MINSFLEQNSNPEVNRNHNNNSYSEFEGIIHLIESIEISHQTNEKIKRAVEGQKVIIDIEPIEENFGATAIRCNYCKRQNGCPIFSFDLSFRQKCCPSNKLPVDYSRVEKFPIKRLTEFLNNSLQ